MDETTMPSVAQTEEESVDLETTEETVDSTEESTEESTESAINWEVEAKKQLELAKNQRIRAEKAERLLKTKAETKVEAKVEQKDLSSKDTIALINAKVHEDDVDEVVEYARFKKIPIAEALKSSVIKASLTERQEHRNTANATNTGKAKSGNARPTGSSLLEKALQTGEMPDRDEDIEALAEARLRAKMPESR